MLLITKDPIALNELDDKRIKGIKPLIPPQILMEDIPLTLQAAQTILEGRRGAEAIIKGADDRLLVVVGPCSIHDVKAAKEYGIFNHTCILFIFLLIFYSVKLLN